MLARSTSTSSMPKSCKFLLWQLIFFSSFEWWFSSPFPELEMHQTPVPLCPESAAQFDVPPPFLPRFVRYCTGRCRFLEASCCWSGVLRLRRRQRPVRLTGHAAGPRRVHQPPRTGWRGQGRTGRGMRSKSWSRGVKSVGKNAWAAGRRAVPRSWWMGSLWWPCWWQVSFPRSPPEVVSLPARGVPVATEGRNEMINMGKWLLLFG